MPKSEEKKQVYGITFQQGRNDIKMSTEGFTNIVTANKVLSEEVKRDMVIALVTLKYTQSNSVCYVKNGQAIGVGAGQQSRIHCTRLAGEKADFWNLRQHEKVINLPFKENIGRPTRDNAIDTYLGEYYMYFIIEGGFEDLLLLF